MRLREWKWGRKLLKRRAIFYSGETDYKGRYNDKVIRQKQSKAKQKDSAFCEAKARGAEMRQKSLFEIGFQAESKTWEPDPRICVP